MWKEIPRFPADFFIHFCDLFHRFIFQAFFGLLKTLKGKKSIFYFNFEFSNLCIPLKEKNNKKS
jgi:hypothetical protein